MKPASFRSNKKFSLNENPDPEDILIKYMKDINKYRTITPEEEILIAKRIRAGDKKAVKELVHANLPFVITVAKNYNNQGIPLIDLINIGNMGLMIAAKRFDHRKNFKFISYAVWWIRQSILKALAEQPRLIKMPLNRTAQLSNFKKIREKIEKEQHRSASQEEIESILKIKNPDILSDIRSMETHTLSLNKPLENGLCLMDFVRDEDASTDGDLLIESEREDIERHLEVLTKMERKVIYGYFGLDQGKEMTLTEMGKRFKLTKERIRQIKDIALKKLRKKYHVSN